MIREDFFRMIHDRFGVEPDYPFANDFVTAVFRRKDNLKWFAIVMSVDCLKDFLLADGWQVKTVLVSGPYGQSVEASYLAKGDRAVIEMATCCGLTLVPKEQRRVMFASSYGLGEVIKDAYLQGVRQIHIGLGGSATNDLGLGCMQALGVKFFNADGQPITDHISAHDFCIVHHAGKIPDSPGYAQSGNRPGRQNPADRNSCGPRLGK